MRLSAKTLNNFVDINHFSFANQWVIRSGEPSSVYLQLVDLEQNGLRYLPQGATPSVAVTFPSIDDTKTIVATATAVTGDGSLWKVDLTALQTPNSGNVVVAVTEGGVTRQFSLLNAIAVEFPGKDGSA